MSNVSQHNTKGFTLIEMLVAVSIFAVVCTFAVSTLLVLLDANRKAQTLETAINNTFFGLESMTRLVRTGYAYYCSSTETTAAWDLSGTPTPYKDAVLDQGSNNGCAMLFFTDDTGRRIRLFLSSGVLMREVNNDGTLLPLTSANLAITTLKFNVTGSTPASSGNNSEPPVVTITIAGNADYGQDSRTDVRMQMTITQRALDL